MSLVEPSVRDGRAARAQRRSQQGWAGFDRTGPGGRMNGDWPMGTGLRTPTRASLRLRLAALPSPRRGRVRALIAFLFLWQVGVCRSRIALASSPCTRRTRSRRPRRTPDQVRGRLDAGGGALHAVPAWFDRLTMRRAVPRHGPAGDDQPAARCVSAAASLLDLREGGVSARDGAHALGGGLRAPRGAAAGGRATGADVEVGEARGLMLSP